MIAVHWSPVKNTKHILKQGIKRSEKGVFCFPLTGIYYLDRWWPRAFRRWRPRTQYNGFLFRITAEDLPASFGHWVQGSEIRSLQALEAQYREAIIFRIGERHLGYTMEALVKYSIDDMQRIGAELVRKNPQIIAQVVQNNPQFLEYIFEDYEILLCHSIAAERIIKVIPGGGQFGRQIAKKRKYAEHDFYEY